MTVPIFQVDAFTDKPFTGNPAGVCILPEPCQTSWMQNVARELYLPETAFLEQRPDGFNLRWFSPQIEIDLCGHATLASAHVLWEEGYLEPNESVRFHTRSGVLAATRTGDWMELDFPSTPEERAVGAPSLEAALGVAPKYIGLSRFDYLVELDSEQTVRNLKPDFARIAELPVRGVIVTALSESCDYEFVSRFFAPSVGVDEDPVTGSAHCCLGPFWASRLNRSELVGYQASQRGGFVRVKVAGDRVRLGGQALTVLKGELACGENQQNGRPRRLFGF